MIVEARRDKAHCTFQLVYSLRVIYTSQLKNETTTTKKKILAQTAKNIYWRDQQRHFPQIKCIR